MDLGRRGEPSACNRLRAGFGRGVVSRLRSSAALVLSLPSPVAGFTKSRGLATSRLPFRVEFVELVARRASLGETAGKSLERLAIIKEATGNLAAATALFGTLWFLGDRRKLEVLSPPHLGWPYLALLLGIAVGMLVTLHCDHYCKEVTMQGLLETGGQERLTLDTSFLDDPPKSGWRDTVQRLLQLREEGGVDLAVTPKVRWIQRILRETRCQSSST